MAIYFDNAATTKPSPSAIAEFSRVSEEMWGNPSSMHGIGLAAENIIKAASKTVSGLIGAEPEEIIYTSGGTEANNTAVLGAMKPFYNNRRAKAVTTVFEHPSVSECFKKLSDMGYEVIYTKDPARIAENIDGGTKLASVVFVNSETGNVSEIEHIGNAVKEKNPGVLFHVDAVQAFGKYRIDVKKAKIDLMSISSHKIRGLKGTGALYVRNGVSLDPVIHGGGQQKGLRSGTENTAGTAAFAAAAKESCENLDGNFENAVKIKKILLKTADLLDGVSINGGAENSPYILSMSFSGVRSEVLLHALEEKGIFVSAGSACSSKQRKHNSLVNMGIEKEYAESAVRFSFSGENTVSEAEEAVKALAETVPMLKRYGGIKT